MQHSRISQVLIIFMKLPLGLKNSDNFSFKDSQKSGPALRSFGREIINTQINPKDETESMGKTQFFSKFSFTRGDSLYGKQDPLFSSFTQEKVMGNPQMVEGYSNEIIEYIHSSQKSNNLLYRPLESLQKDITDKMRGILIDWLVDVHNKFKLRDETLFLTVNLIDRFLSRVAVEKQKFQLLGVSAMLIACKYEEIYAPEVKDFVYVTDNAYTKNDVLSMEAQILEEIGFSLLIQSPKLFLERFLCESPFSEKAKMLSRYVLELSLLDFNSGRYSSSSLASGSLYLAAKLFKESNPWPSNLQSMADLLENEVRPAAKELCILLQNADKSQFQAVKRKFSAAKYLSISKVQLEKK